MWLCVCFHRNRHAREGKCPSWKKPWHRHVALFVSTETEEAAQGPTWGHVFCTPSNSRPSRFCWEVVQEVEEIDREVWSATDVDGSDITTHRCSSGVRFVCATFSQIHVPQLLHVDTYHSYRKSGNFRYMKFTLEKFSCWKIFVGSMSYENISTQKFYNIEVGKNVRREKLPWKSFRKEFYL